MDIKNLIANHVQLQGLNSDDILKLIQENQTDYDGEYTIPCFALAKLLHKSPIQIANDIKQSFLDTPIIEKIEVVNGYVNFFLNRAEFIKNILIEVSNNDNYYYTNEFVGKTACFDYSSVNLAKYMHIGHLSTTIIGESLARIYSSVGYKCVRINYIGDYGTPFGKMIYAHLTYGSEKELNERGIDYIQDMYVKFCKEAEINPEIENFARDYFKKIEEKDSTIFPIYKKIIDISKKEAKNLLDLLGIKFNSWKGESSYSPLIPKTINELENKNLLTQSEGAKIVDLTYYNLGVCLIQKSDGTSLYASRDITAVIDRYKHYKFDKMIYITAVQQKLHFEQFFKVLELLGYECSKNLVHVYYGMFSLPNGKIASRKGKQAVLKDIFEYSYNKSYSIVSDRQFQIEDKKDVASKIAMSALKFNAIKNDRIKDAVFDIDNCFNFDGDTSAYMQYTYARICSVLRKVKINNYKNIDYSYLTSEECFNITFIISNYMQTLKKAYVNNEPSIISKYTIDLCKFANKFYMSEKVISDNKQQTKAKAFLLKVIKTTLKKCFNLICIDTIEEM